MKKLIIALLTVSAVGSVVARPYYSDDNYRGCSSCNKCDTCNRGPFWHTSKSIQKQQEDADRVIRLNKPVAS